METQCLRILNYLDGTDEYGKPRTLTNVSAMTILGISKFSARLTELRRRGIDIRSRDIKTLNRYGQPTHYFEYYLHKEN